jgi:hypothetical protein
MGEVIKKNVQQGFVLCLSKFMLLKCNAMCEKHAQAYFSQQDLALSGSRSDAMFSCVTLAFDALVHDSCFFSLFFYLRVGFFCAQRKKAKSFRIAAKANQHERERE